MDANDQNHRGLRAFPAEDIPLIVQSFIERYFRKLGKQITPVHKETMKVLQDYLCLARQCLGA